VKSFCIAAETRSRSFHDPHPEDFRHRARPIRKLRDHVIIAQQSFLERLHRQPRWKHSAEREQASSVPNADRRTFLGDLLRRIGNLGI
jgi:hypothetical protein